MNHSRVVKLGKEREVNGQVLIKQLQKCLILKVFILEVSVSNIIRLKKREFDYGRSAFDLKYHPSFQVQQV